MVVRGNLSPDPSCVPDDVLPSNVGVIVGSSSDSEGEEEISYEGYEVLPQQFVEVNNGEADDSDSQEGSSDEEGSSININLTNIREPPSFDQSTKSELTELWNATSIRETDIIIDSAKEEQIKNAMAGFKLPSTAIPAWAAQIPEEEWKEQLKNRVALLNKVTSS